MICALGAIADVSTGYPFRKKVESEEGGDVVLVQIKDLDGAEGVTASGAVTLRDDGGKYRKYLLQAGDLLFQSRGSRHPVAVVEPDIRGIAATGLHTIRPHPQKVLPAYLAWCSTIRSRRRNSGTNSRAAPTSRSCRKRRSMRSKCPFLRWMSSIASSRSIGCTGRSVSLTLVSWN